MKVIKNQLFILLFTIAACFITAIYFGFIRGEEVVYTHFFYIPILLAGMWYRKKAVFVALGLSIVYILITHFSLQTISTDNFARVAVFITVAYVIGLVSQKRAEGEDRIRMLNEELESKVEQRTNDLMKERNYTRHLIESSPDFQLTLNKDGVIMDVNEAFEKTLDKSRGDIIGESIYEYLPREETEKLIAEIFDKGKLRNVELTADIPERGTLICNISGTVFTTPEGKVGIYISGRDITEQKREENELRKKELQLVHASRLSSLGEMATAIAHEINQPLSIISMAAEGILRDIKKSRLDVGMFPKDIEDIMNNVKRIDRLITHMRSFARQPEEWRSAKPEELLDNAFIMLDEQFRVHNISVSCETEKNLPAIEVDPHQLEQVFINILTNARQVLDSRGEEAEREGKSFQKQLLCRISRENDRVVFEFADNADGVPDELKLKIFEPFFTTKEAGEGTGLGLSIAYGIVTRSLGGKIWVEDNEMAGASFKVALPVMSKN